jgi:polar amino acid transport system substrate-binding protein
MSAQKLCFMTILAVLFLSACGGAAASPEGCLGTSKDALVDLNCEEVTIAVENAYLPFNYITKDGKAGGWDYDAFNEICTRLHCTPVFQEAAWEGMIQAVSDGQFKTAGDGITINAERAEIVDFSEGYIDIQQRLLVRKGETRIQAIEDIVNDPELKLGTQSGTTNYETAAKYLPEDRIQAFEQFAFAVQALGAGDIDAVIIDQVAGLVYMGENADKVELVGPSISSDQLGFIFPKGSKLTGQVNIALAAMKADGTLEKLNTKYFGPDFKIASGDIQ